MGVIHVLPESVANKIAAGEVIERPASIVKELVENSLDAGAKSVEVAISHGGRSLIRVSDDGQGMSAEDASLAFKRYATSKITEADDLLMIGSFGFRGEALPSIAAVSRIKLTTRARGTAIGTEITMEGGKLTSAKEAACREGTTVEVRDLFFNTPARRKFLKSESTETGHIYDAVAHLALSKVDCGFTLKNGEEVLLSLLPGESLKARAAQILGEDLTAHLLEFEEEISGIRIHGLIGKPHAARANRSGQIFFVNRRWVRSLSLGYALNGGYHGLLMHGQYPVAILFVEADLGRVDVNVHPTKQEVRISNEAEIKSLVKEAVEKRLAQEPDLAPTFQPRQTFPERVFEQAKRQGDYTELYLKPGGKAGVQEPPGFYQPSQAKPLAEPISLRNKFKITKVLGQIHSTFIVCETEEGLLLVDQHAAHERVMFEALVKSFKEGHAASQRLLMEEVVELNPKHREVLAGSLGMLTKLGFEIEPFGEKSFVVRAVPAVLGEEHAGALLKGFLEQKEDGSLKTDLEKAEEEVAALIACKKKSVRAYDALQPLQLTALLERLAACSHPFSCPHGRPAFLKQSFLDLEKQFKRK